MRWGNLGWIAFCGGQQIRLRFVAVVGGGWPETAVARGVFRAASGFGVGWRAPGPEPAPGSFLLVLGSFLLVLVGLSFWRGAGRWAIILWSLGSFVIFSNLLRVFWQFVYTMFISNNRTSFYLW